MPPTARTSYPPLDVEATRNAVAAGRTVRVGILPTHQFPDGGAGRIKQVGQPDSDGAEFIQVEVSVGGSKDVIPFAPGDLSPIKRTQAAPEPTRPINQRRPRIRKPASTSNAVADPGRGAGQPMLADAALPTAPVGAAISQRSVEPGAGGAVGSATGSDRAPAVLRSVASGAGAAAPLGTAAGSAGNPPIDRRAARPAVAPTPEPPLVRKPARGKRQPIVVTLATTEPDHTGWQLEVKVGSKLVIKPTPIHPARAWSLVTDLGNPEVARVVAGALNEHRQAAQERADRLARELAEAQEELANYPTF